MNCVLFIPYFCLIILCYCGFFFLFVCVCIYIHTVERNYVVKQIFSGEKLGTPTYIWCLVNEAHKFLLKQLP